MGKDGPELHWLKCESFATKIPVGVVFNFYTFSYFSYYPESEDRFQGTEVLFACRAVSRSFLIPRPGVCVYSLLWSFVSCDFTKLW